jgi:uncharacterized tellurite resistance protein B-like protein
MLDALKALFARESARPGAAERASDDPDRGLRVAACALLLEMAHADDEFSPDERHRVEELVGRHFALDAGATRALLEAAERERREATDLHQLTSVINRHYDEGQRLLLSELLWRVVYADGRLSQHEDYLTQKLATLLDLRPGYLAEARKRARG